MSEAKTVLDHGYVTLIESYGSDERIIEAARMSTGKGFLGWGALCPECNSPTEWLGEEQPPGYSCLACGKMWHADECKPGDEKLLRHLWVNKHATPFEMAGAICEVQAPIFVFREWHRHRTQSYNEMSARYTPLPDLNYIPSLERLMIAASTTNKQAGTITGAAVLTEAGAEIYRTALADMYAEQEALYQSVLRSGVPKELARVHLPVGRYSRMRAHANLRNWLGFLTLRMDKTAQWEIRQYANAVHEILAAQFPRTLVLFDEGRSA